MAKPSKLYSFCSLLMALLFAYSTSVQCNDPDWYFWIPLYGCGCAVNLLNWLCWFSKSRTISYVTKANLGLGIYLFMRALAEDYANGIPGVGFLSLDLSERVVREKAGSGMAVSSMILLLMGRSTSPTATRYIYPGMAMALAYGLAFLFFFVVHKGQMKF